MKKIFLISTFYILFGCTEEGKTYYYTITNNSGVPVEIIPYTQQGDLLLGKKTTLLNGKSINKKEFNGTPGGGSPDIARAIPSDEYLKKVEFVFNNTKKNLYSRCGFTINGVVANCDDTRNIFNERTETYIITPEDYQNAIDCGGNCN